MITSSNRSLSSIPNICAPCSITSRFAPAAKLLSFHFLLTDLTCRKRETLDAVIEARARAVASTGTPDSQARDEGVLVSTLRELFAVVEAYPQLKANQNFLHLQEELVITENRIQAARRFYNGNVRDLNTRVAVFPSNLIASMFSIGAEEFFEVAEVVRTVPKVRL